MSKVTQNQWRNGSCSDLVSLFNGFAFKSKDQQENGIRWLKIANVGIGKIKWNEESFLPINYRQEYERYLLKENDIVVAMTRPTLNNKLKIAKISSNDTSLLNQRVARIDIKNDNVKEFIYQLFRSDYIARKINEALKGTDPPNLSVTVLDDIYINIPPLAEQEKIAEILSTWDQAIDSTEKLIANAELQKKALMQQLLTGKKRLLNENGERFSGKWEKVKLGSLIQEIKKEKVQNPNEIELLTVRLHHKGAIPSGKFPKATAKGRPYYRRCKGELIIGRQNLHNGGIAIVNEECHNLIASNAISSFKNTSLADIQFLLCLMSTNQFKFTVDTLTGGTGQKEISTIELKKIIIKVPEIQEQQKIAEVLSTADREIELLTEKLEYLKAEKKALMQQLLTGKRRVKVA